MIHFPVAALILLLGSDIGYAITGDIFWARASFWLAGVGTVGGLLSGLAGLLDLVLVPRIRRLVTAWAHAVLAVTLLSLAAMNFVLRWDDPVTLLLPWGLYLSVLTASLITITGFLGAQLVFEYGVGVDVASLQQRRQPP